MSNVFKGRKETLKVDNIGGVDFLWGRARVCFYVTHRSSRTSKVREAL